MTAIRLIDLPDEDCFTTMRIIYKSWRKLKNIAKVTNMYVQLTKGEKIEVDGRIYTIKEVLVNIDKRITTYYVK